MNFGLERTRSLLDALGKPDETLKIIHVAGTNGKGSVCAYLSTVLLTCGYTVGRFNSPHLIEPRDSFSINGQPVQQAEYLDACKHIAGLNKRIGASNFECQVAIAFYLFHRAQLEFVVLEVGLGGKEDATNVIQPVMSIITAIGMDHVKILGNSLEEIALAKAGIMKPGRPVVIAPQEEPIALETLRCFAEETQCPYEVAIPSTRIDSDGHSLQVGSNHYVYRIRLHGDYQRMNSATAVNALDWLHRLGVIQLTDTLLSKGMEDTRWPGRLDWIEKKQLNGYQLDRLLVDGAHNSPAAAALHTYVEGLVKKRVVWIMGATVEKDMKAMLDQLVQPGDALLAVSFSQPENMPWIESADPAQIISQARNVKETWACTSLIEALEKAGSMCGKEDVVVLCGSLYLAADLYRLLSSEALKRKVNKLIF